MTGGGPTNGSGARSARSELARLRESGEHRDREAQERIEAAMLELCAERGYRDLAVGAVIERSGYHRAGFYRHFANKAECFESAWAAEAVRWWDQLAAAAEAEPDWRRSFCAALNGAAALIEKRPGPARSLLVEVNVAGGEALAHRDRLHDQVAAAIDCARQDSHSSHDPPPITARFMVGLLESAAVKALTDGEPERFREELPELAGIVVGAYYDQALAAEEISARG